MNTRDRKRWQTQAFEVQRPGMGGAAPRTVLVQGPLREAAHYGLGLYKDERALPCGLPAFAGLRAGRPVSSSELADFFQGFGCALKAGMPLSGALGMAARQARTPRMRGVVGLLAFRVARGVELHLAMAEVPEVFAESQVALARAASKSCMAEAGALFVELAASLQNDARVGRKLAGALSYPVTLLVMALGAAVILELKALPPMVELFRAMGAKLPPLTQAFYEFARLLIDHALPSALLACALCVTLVFGGRALLRSRRFQCGVVRAWFVGPILMARALSRSLGVFVLLKQGGANNRDIFHLSAAAAGNALVEDFFLRTYARVTRGETVEEAFLAERHLLGEEGMRLAGRMEVGLEGGELGPLLRSAVREMDEKAELRLTLLPRALELPLLALCGLIIGLIILAMFLPYPSLLGDIARQMRG